MTTGSIMSQVAELTARIEALEAARPISTGHSDAKELQLIGARLDALEKATSQKDYLIDQKVSAAIKRMNLESLIVSVLDPMMDDLVAVERGLADVPRLIRNGDEATRLDIGTQSKASRAAAESTVQASVSLLLDHTQAFVFGR